jgi:hypothetical protein
MVIIIGRVSDIQRPVHVANLDEGVQTFNTSETVNKWGGD